MLTGAFALLKSTCKLVTCVDGVEAEQQQFCVCYLSSPFEDEDEDAGDVCHFTPEGSRQDVGIIPCCMAEKM